MSPRVFGLSVYSYLILVLLFSVMLPFASLLMYDGVIVPPSWFHGENLAYRGFDKRHMYFQLFGQYMSFTKYQKLLE